MNEDLLQEKLEKYVRGQLPAQEAMAFEQEIAENSVLQEQVQLHRLEIEATEYLIRNNVRQQAKAWLAESHSIPQKKNIRWSPQKLLFLILMLGLVGIVIYRMNNIASPTPIIPETNATEQPGAPPVAQQDPVPDAPVAVAPNASTNPNTAPKPSRTLAGLSSHYRLPRNLSEGVLKSSESTSIPETPLSAGILAYQSNDFNKAIQAFSAIKESDDPMLYALAQEWLAHSWFSKGFQTTDFAPAARLFEARVAQNTKDAAQDQAEWYLTLSLYGNYAQNKEKVQALLQKMATDEYHTYRQQALQLLGELNTQGN